MVFWIRCRPAIIRPFVLCAVSPMRSLLRPHFYLIDDDDDDDADDDDDDGVSWLFRRKIRSVYKFARFWSSLSLSSLLLYES